ncbi:hypothetical protein [Streptomyces sp. NPDC012510]|uniref:hypothetical protein n=1 Tax=Streptomyces sp. NPDC012510 TaxID=3364838 RepID=UPI0036E8434C
MSSTGAMTLPESEAPRQPPRRTREITVGAVVATLPLSVLATALGPLGIPRSASVAAPHEARFRRLRPARVRSPCRRRTP